MSSSVEHTLHNTMRDLLHLETESGLGCTDPAAVALCAAGAASLVSRDAIESIDVKTDRNVFKNAMSVIIPASGGSCGIPLAAAMGAVSGNPENGLEIFSTVDPEGLEMAKTLVNTGKVTAGIAERSGGIYIKVVITAGGHRAEAVISGQHNHFDSLFLDGAPQRGHDFSGSGIQRDGDVETLEKWPTSLSVGEIVDLLDDLDDDDVSYIRQGIQMNMRLVDHGLSHGPGLAVGKTQLALVGQGLLSEDLALMSGITAAAGIDARMAGVKLPAMTLGGSGNQGIAAGAPLVTVSDLAGLDDDPLLLVKAVTLSYLITCTIKAYTGRLCALCGSAVASGAGVAAGVTYLLGGTVEQIGGAIMNHVGTTATILCDGAKAGCALKVGEAVCSATKLALLALQGVSMSSRDGIMGQSPEETMRNLGLLSTQGLDNMDPAILNIMLERCP